MGKIHPPNSLECPSISGCLSFCWWLAPQVFCSCPVSLAIISSITQEGLLQAGKSRVIWLCPYLTMFCLIKKFLCLRNPGSTGEVQHDSSLRDGLLRRGTGACRVLGASQNETPNQRWNQKAQKRQVGTSKLTGRTPGTAAVTAPPCQLGSAHLAVQPGDKGNTGIKMEGNTLEVELRQKREEKCHVKENNIMSCYSCLLVTGCE